VCACMVGVYSEECVCACKVRKWGEGCVFEV